MLLDWIWEVRENEALPHLALATGPFNEMGKGRKMLSGQLNLQAWSPEKEPGRGI